MTGDQTKPSTPSPPSGRVQKGEQANLARLIRRAHQQWSHRGIIEIDQQHWLYNISRCIQMGIRGCIQPHPADKEENETYQERDFLEVTTQTHYEKDIKKQFEFRSYAPKVFASLRGLVGVTEAEYLESLAPSGPPVPCLEFITSSKSGMMFFLCNNKAFIMKTEKPQDIAFLRSQFLCQLVRHFHDFPHSLLVKIMGCYYIKMSGSKGLYVTVMQSVFYPDERITKRYDLKGCSAGRYVQPLEEGSTEVIVLKDNNFDGRKIDIGAQASWFRRQVDIDSRFLEEQGIMDYSLLLGIQKLHADEKKTSDKLADVVSRARRSIKPVSDSPNRVCPDCGDRFPTWNRRSCIQTQQSNRQPTQPPQPQDTNETADNAEQMVQEILDININADSHRHVSHSAGHHRAASGEIQTGILQLGSEGDDVRNDTTQQPCDGKMIVGGVEDENERHSLPGMVENNLNQPGIDNHEVQGISTSQPSKLLRRSPNSDPKALHSGTNYCQCTSRFQIDRCNERNQRLLPDTVNPLHIIDGDDYRYFVGIVDVLTQYGIKKKMEYLYKCLRYPTEPFSTVKPELYAKRFRQQCYEKTEQKTCPEEDAST